MMVLLAQVWTMWLLAVAGAAAVGVGVAMARSRRARAAQARAEGLVLGLGLRDGAGVRQSVEQVAGEVRARLGRAESEASAARARAEVLTRVLDAIDEPIVATDTDGRVMVCNASAGAFLGTPSSRLVGRPVEEVFTHAELLRLHGLAGQAGKVRDRVRMGRPEGERILEVWGVALAGGERGSGAGERSGIGGVVMVLRDVTDLSRALQMKTDFVANASHELRTPIATIKASLETLEAGARDDPWMRDRIHAALMQQTVRLEEMARDLLDLTRLESTDGQAPRREVSIPEIVAAVEPMFAKACEVRDLRLVFEVDPALDGAGEREDEHAGRPVRSNRALLELILQNLIDNATKFALEGTVVRVVIRAMGVAKVGVRGERHVEDGEGSPGLHIEVSDQGMGIPLADQSRIFERFYQVDEARTTLGGGHRRGSGLGLAIVKHAVKSLGGTIRVQSVWKQGTTMVVELPGEGIA